METEDIDAIKAMQGIGFLAIILLLIGVII
jgi:hypothetical protein